MRTLAWIPTGCRPLFGAALLLFGGTMWSLAPSAAEARIIACRADPIVSLSSGTQVRMAVSIGTDASQVRFIAYTLHAPRGMSIQRVIYPHGYAALKETVRLRADMPRDTYVVDAFVAATGSNVRVTASTRVSSMGSGSVAGLAGQHLIIHPSR